MSQEAVRKALSTQESIKKLGQEREHFLSDWDARLAFVRSLCDHIWENLGLGYSYDPVEDGPANYRKKCIVCGLIEPQ